MSGKVDASAGGAKQMNVFQQLCKKAGLPEPVTEYKFHPTRKWRFDYALVDEKLAIEVEGGVWLSKHGKKSRHFHGKGAHEDMVKYREAAALGWRVIRVTPKELLTAETIQLIKRSTHV